MYKPELLDKPQVLLINKMDTECFNEKYEETLNLLKNCRGTSPIFVGKVLSIRVLLKHHLT